MNVIAIGEQRVGEGHPCFIIAEAGVNHDGSVEKAKRLIDAAVEAKADAVKFQTFKTEKLILDGTPKAQYHARTTGNEGSFDDLLRTLELDEAAHLELSDYAASCDIKFMSTPFDEESADLLERIGVDVYKVDSGNFNNPALVSHIASKGKPIILSTGMTTLGEIEETLDVLSITGNEQIVLLHCTSNYPPSLEDVNLNAMETIRSAFMKITGYSDHTEGSAVSVAAVALGASVIEKHLTLDRNAPGPDHIASLEPEPFADMVRQIRDVERALGCSIKKPVAAESDVKRALRRSVVSVTEIPQGAVITAAMVAVKRPGTGLPPKYLDWVVGRPARKDISANQTITFDYV